MIKKERTGIILAYIMQFLIFALIFISFFKDKYAVAFGAIIALIITFIPAIIEKKWNISLPWTLNLLLALSLYLHIGGMAFEFYNTVYFYDKFQHFFGSVTIALLGFSSVVVVNNYSKLKLGKEHIIFFIIIFTMAIGAFWEIFEFIQDLIFHTNTQHGLNDTMIDMIFNFFGGLLIAIITKVNYETMSNHVVKIKN